MTSEPKRDAQQAIRARRSVLYGRTLRAKLAAIRDEALELQAVLEFVHFGDALADPVWQFADRTVRHAEEIMANKCGELSLPEPKGAKGQAKRQAKE